MKQFVFGAFVTSLVFLFAKDPAFAQAGAAGGVVGKQNKDASGGADAPPPRRAAPKRAPRPVQSETPRPTGSLTAASISGHWRVAVTCVDGSDVWTFDIREESATSFTGDYGPGGGKITNGSINGNEVSLVTQTSGQRIWTGTLSGSGGGMRIRGSMTGLGIKTWDVGNCRFDATKG